MSHQCENEQFDQGSHNSHHNHNHNHGHDHTPNVLTNANQSLFQYIDTSKIRVLNGTTRTTPIYDSFIKSQEDKFDISKYMESDADCQLIIQIPFTGSCKITSILLRTNGNTGQLSSPKNINFYKNFKKHINLDFDTINSLKPDVKIEHPNNVGIIDNINETISIDDSNIVEHHFPKSGFADCDSITMFIENNWAGDEDYLSRLYYLEIRGELTNKRKHNDTVPLMAVYESAPNPLDHSKIKSEHNNVNLGI